MKWLKNKLTKLRLSCGFFTYGEVMHVLETIGHCKDRDDYAWKVKCKLTEMTK